MQSAYALRICIADTDRGSVRMEMYTKAMKLHIAKASKAKYSVTCLVYLKHQ